MERRCRRWPGTVFVLLSLLAAGWAVSATRTGSGVDIDRLMKRMTLREKIGQLFIVPVFGNTTGPALSGYLNGLKPGGIIILGTRLENAYVVKRVCDHISRQHHSWRVPVPMFTSVNQEGGSVNRLRVNAALFPTAMALGASGSTNLIYNTGLAIGRQLRAAGLNMNYAPVLDMNLNPSNQVIGYRAFSDRKQVVIRYAAAFARGLKDAGVIPVGKHFPGHGRTTLDSHWFLPSTSTPASVLYRNDFDVFRSFPRGLLPAVMTAHVVYRSIDNVPATISTNIIAGFFRKKTGYNGVIMTDDIFMKALSRRYSYPEIVKKALLAGNDIISTSLPYRININLIRHIERLVKTGVVTMKRLDRSVRRILMLKREYGLFNRKPVPAATAREWFHGNAVKALARRTAHDGVTVMRDPGKILPLNKCGKTLIVSYKNGFNWRLRSLLLKDKRASMVSVMYVPYGARAVYAWRIYNRARYYDTVIFGGGDRKDAPTLRLLARYRKKRIVAVSFNDPYWPGQVKGSFSYVATFSYYPVSAQACAEKLAGLSPFRGKPPITVFPRNK